ncbi:MAG: two-component system response regulator HydG [Candidatus Krumholzibacteriia bacterium]|jgi:two-component system response regulator HydG
MKNLDARVLIVDDELMLRRTMSDRMNYWGCVSDEAESGEEALDILERKSYDLVLMDLKMGGISGLDVIKAMRERNDMTEVVVLTAHGTVEYAVEAIQAGATDFLLKPADFDLVHNTVKRILAAKRLALAHAALQERRAMDAPFVIGDSEAMISLVDEARRAAPSKATILLNGESGSGKGVIAEYVHQQSDRSKGPFVYVNCVALSDDLIESTLFGHERGAFTGAIARKTGHFEGANSGTAFLDEIGDISPRLQTKLLHFLESGEFERVGGTKTLRVDCRIVAATNRDLKVAVAEGRFREDLLYRLNVIGLTVPPLRDRKEDIAVLANFFLAMFAADLKRAPLKISPETAAIMRNYSWPGNVRQIKNAVERMVVMAQNEMLTPDLLPPEVLSGEGHVTVTLANDGEVLPLRDAERDFRKSHFRRALAVSGGNQTEAAKLLDIQRSSLNRQMKELGLRDEGEDS